MNNIDKQYQTLLQDIIDNGVTKSDRTGTGTISVFGRQIRHKMSEGFPLLTTKKMPFKTIVTELLWFLRGDTNIKYLVDNNCHIWTGDAYKAYREARPLDIYAYTIEEFEEQIKTNSDFALRYGELGPIYGKQWRKWKRYRKVEDIEHKETLHIIDYIDQIQNLINDLKTNPDSRRLMVNAWNVGELDQMVLPPCHYGFQVYTRELSENERLQILLPDVTEQADGLMAFGLELLMKRADEKNIPNRAISLMWNQRSVDTFLGLPFNIASYGLLLHIISNEVNMIPDELIGNLGDVHLYSNHIDAAKEQIGRDFTEEDENEDYPKLRQIREKKKEAIDNQHYGLAAGYREEEKNLLRTLPERRTREPFPLPTLKLPDYDMFEGEFCPEYWLPEDFKIENYQSHPAIKAPLSN
jgi:thymidylate synthase